MQRTETTSTLRSHVRRAALLAAATFVTACNTTGTTRPGQVATRDVGGFTISERTRVGTSVRNDFEKAVRMLEQDESEGAIVLLLEVTEAAPDLVAPHVDLGIAYGRVGELEKAEASLREALELNPRHPVACNELGIVYRRMGRFEEARASYEQALAEYPGFHFARRNLAILCDVYLSDVRCAIENYELYSKAVPGDEEAAMWIADLRNRTGE